MLLDDLGGVYPIHVLSESKQRSGVYLRLLEDDRIFVGGRYRFDQVQICGPSGAGFREAAAQTRHTVIVIYHIIGSQLPTVHRWLIMPVNALADVEDKCCVVGLFPTLRQVPFIERQRRG